MAKSVSMHVNKFVHPVFRLPQTITREEAKLLLKDTEFRPQPIVRPFLDKIQDFIIEKFISTEDSRLKRFTDSTDLHSDDEETLASQMLFDDLKQLNRFCHS